MITIPTKSEGDLLHASEINEIVSFVNRSTLHKYDRIAGSSSPSFTVLDDITGKAKDSGVILIEPSTSTNKKLQNYEAKINGYQMGLLLGSDFVGLVNGNSKTTHDGAIILHNTGKVEITTGYTDWGIDINTLSSISIQAVDGLSISSSSGAISLYSARGIVLNTEELHLISPNIQMPNLPNYIQGVTDPSSVTRLLYMNQDGVISLIPLDQLQTVIDYYSPPVP